jgi:hypothetical protein
LFKPVRKKPVNPAAMISLARLNDPRPNGGATDTMEELAARIPAKPDQ